MTEKEDLQAEIIRLHNTKAQLEEQNKQLDEQLGKTKPEHIDQIPKKIAALEVRNHLVDYTNQGMLYILALLLIIGLTTISLIIGSISTILITIYISIQIVRKHGEVKRLEKTYQLPPSSSLIDKIKNRQYRNQ